MCIIVLYFFYIDIHYLILLHQVNNINRIGA